MISQRESDQALNILDDKQPMIHAWVLAQLIDIKNDIQESGKCLGYIKLEDGKMAEVFISTKRIPE